MDIDLDREDLKSLARGIYPRYDVMDNPKVSKQGEYYASHGGWEWYFGSFENCTEDEILEIYKICKDSWKQH